MVHYFSLDQTFVLLWSKLKKCTVEKSMTNLVLLRFNLFNNCLLYFPISVLTTMTFFELSLFFLCKDRVSRFFPLITSIYSLFIRQTWAKEVFIGNLFFSIVELVRIRKGFWLIFTIASKIYVETDIKPISWQRLILLNSSSQIRGRNPFYERQFKKKSQNFVQIIFHHHFWSKLELCMISQLSDSQFLTWKIIRAQVKSKGLIIIFYFFKHFLSHTLKKIEKPNI